MADLIASENLFAPLLYLFLLLCAISWTGGRRPALAAAIGAVVGALALTRRSRFSCRPSGWSARSRPGVPGAPGRRRRWC